MLSLLAGIVSIIPLLLTIPSGDTVMNYAQIQCFSTALWQGDFYPRWCMEINSGMGSPAPIFYFPLPYYFTALFHPLRSLGVDLTQELFLGLLLADCIAFATCTLWLTPLVGRRVGYFCALVFLWSGYRGELLVRMAYAEIWCLSFLPLVLLYTRSLCLGVRGSAPKLALAVLICLFCHAPVTLVGLMAAGAFVVLYTRARLGILARFIASVALAAGISAFHYVPTRVLTSTLNATLGGLEDWKRSWVNSYIDVPGVYFEHYWAVVSFCVTGVFSIALFTTYYLLRRRVQNPAHAREAWAWVMIAGGACFMLFSFSAPLWWLPEAIAGLHTPWRLQALLGLAMVMVLAVLVYHVLRRRATCYGDGLVLFIALAFSHLFYYGGIIESSLSTYQRLMKELPLLGYFATREMDAKYAKGYDNFFDDFVDRPGRTQAAWARGSTTPLRVEQWSHGIIRVSGATQRPATLRLEHFYYPIWQGDINGAPVPLRAEEGAGRIEVDVPGNGPFTLTLSQHYSAMLSPTLRALRWVSLIGAVLLIVLLWRGARRSGPSAPA